MYQWRAYNPKISVFLNKQSMFVKFNVKYDFSDLTKSSSANAYMTKDLTS